jgi:toxin-antitoxin system PIN domain toxin
VIVPDVNVLLYAHQPESTDHARYRRWLVGALRGAEPVGLPDVVLSAFIRVATHPRVFARPASLEQAFDAVARLRAQPAALPLAPGPRHWTLFEHACRTATATGNLVADAYLAALAIEHGAELVTTDRDHARFPGLRWRHPLADADGA